MPSPRAEQRTPLPGRVQEVFTGGYEQPAPNAEIFSVTLAFSPPSIANECWQPVFGRRGKERSWNMRMALCSVVVLFLMAGWMHSAMGG
jgi:hypothetical protein